MYCLFYFKFCGFLTCKCGCKKINKKEMCVYFFYGCFFYDKVAKIKEEFNV
jgi:hypothetical protein